MSLQNLRSLAIVAAIVAAGTLGHATQAEAAFIGIISDATGPSNPFNEASCTGGDAGNTLGAACMVGPGPYDGFAGTIGDDFNGSFSATVCATGPNGCFDEVDVFAFNWMTTANFVATSGILGVGMDLHHYLSHLLVGVDMDSTPEGINISSLAAGNYLLMLNASFDPPFSIGPLTGPTTASGNITSVQPIPEPASLLLLGTGLMAVVRRRRSRASAK